MANGSGCCPASLASELDIPLAPETSRYGRLTEPVERPSYYYAELERERTGTSYNRGLFECKDQRDVQRKLSLDWLPYAFGGCALSTHADEPVDGRIFLLTKWVWTLSPSRSSEGSES